MSIELLRPLIIATLAPFAKEIFQRLREIQFQQHPLMLLSERELKASPLFMPFAESIDNSILDHYTGKSTWTAPAAIWVGLSSTTPTKTGTNVTEPSGGAYARINITAVQFNTAASSATTTNTQKDFAQATADWASGSNLTDLVIYTASTAGTFIGFKALTQAKPVLSGDTARIPSGDLDLVMGGAA